MESEFLKYGDLIVLQSQDFSGNVTSFGFLDTTCYLQQVPDKDLRTPLNSRCMIFQLLPKFNYESVQEFQRLKNAMKQKTGSGQMNLKQEDLDLIENLQQKMETEKELNSRTFRQRCGTRVTYGQEVQFRHVSSQMLLKGKRETAEGDRSCYLLELSENGSSGVHFKLLPRYKYRKEGDYIMYSDYLLIANSKLGLFVHISDKPAESYSNLSFTVINPELCVDIAPTPASFAVLFEVNISTQKSVFQISLFADTLEESRYVRGGAVIRLQHTELGGLLCSEAIDYTRDGLADVFVRKYKGENVHERSSAHSCFILEPEVPKCRGQTCTWRTESHPTLYRLRHLMSRRVVCIASDQSGQIVSLAKHPHEAETSQELTHFAFIPTAMEATNKLREGCIAKIKASGSGLYLATLSEEWVQGEGKGMAGPGDATPPDDTTFFMPLEIDDVVVARKKIVMTETSQIEDAYQINIVEEEEVTDIEFAMSAVHFLRRFAALFEQRKEPDRALFLTVERVLGKLILFCNISEDHNPYTCEGEPHGRRQKFLREVGVIDWVCSILYYPFATGMYSLETLRKTELMTKICVLGYRLVRLAAKDNRVNELYCAQWMGLFLSHAESTTQNENLHPEETLTEILSDNRRLLERQIRPRMVKKFVNLIRRGRDEKYAKLIATLCTCEGQAVTRNQNTICDIIASDPEFTDFMMVKLRASSKVIEVEAAELRTWVRLDSFQQFSEEHDDGKVYYYFLALLDLVSELAFDRNHQTDALRNYYPFEKCFAVVSNNEVSDTVRGKFVRMMLNLHLDQGELQLMVLPNYTRLWAEAAEPFPCAKSKLSLHIQETKKFLFAFLAELGGVLRTSEHSRNELVKQVLVLARFLTSHGAYTSVEELEQLCKPLADLLDGSTDIIVNYASVSSTKALTKVAKDRRIEKLERKARARYEVNEQSAVLIECKLIICNIFTTVMNVRLDFHISQFLGDLKDKKSLWSDQQTPGKRRGSDSDEVQEIEPLKSSNTVRSFSEDNLLETPFEILKKVTEDTTLLITACVDRDLITALTDLMLYDSSDLVHESFLLLLRLFSQLKFRVNALQNIQLLEHDEAVHTLASIREKLTTLTLAAENAEVWLGRELATDTFSGTLSSDTHIKTYHIQVNSILQYFISLCSKANKTPSNLSEEPEKEQQSSSFTGLRAPINRKNASADTSFVFTSPRDYDSSVPLNITEDSEEHIAGVLLGQAVRPNKENQRLMRNLSVYSPVLEIAGHKGILIGYNQDKHRAVLRHCYTFLAAFCHQNPQNQELLYQSLESFIEDLDKNACATLLIQEVFMNNAELCAKVPAKFIRMIVRQINSMPLSLEKAGLFRTLAVLVKCKNHIIKANQLEVVSQLASSDMTNVLLVYTSQHDFAELERNIKECVAQYSTGAQQVEVEMPVNACYLIALIDLLSTCSEEWNAQAEIICQRILSVPQLNRLFEVSPLFWPLRNVLTLFFLNVYLDIEFSSHDNEKMLWLSLERMNYDMDFILNNYTRIGRQYSSPIESVYFRMGDRRANLVEFALHYIYGAVIPTLVEIFMKRGTGLHVESRTELIKSIVQLSCVFHKQATVPRHVRVSSQLIRVIADIEKFRKYLRPEFLDVKDRSPDRKGPAEFPVTEQETGKAAFLMRIARGLQKYPPAIAAIDHEFHSFVLHAKHIGRISNRAGSILTTQEILSAFISFLRKYEGADMAQVRLTGIRTLRKFIETDNEGEDRPAAEWDAEDWAKCKAAIVQSQDLLVKLQIVPLTISTFTGSKDKMVRGECLLLMIALLLGGSSSAQSEFMNQMAENPGNKFLYTLKTMLFACFEQVRIAYQMRIFEAEKRLRERVRESMLDTNMTEGAPSDDETMWVQENIDVEVHEDKHSQHQQLSQNALRFLQLLCEGHNLATQKFLREQTDGAVVHPKSINLVSLIGNLLGMYVKILHKDNLDLGFQILDTLTEFTQGPCRQNQRELSQPKLIDNGRDLLTSLSTKTEKEVRGFDAEDEFPDDISELKSKTASFLLSLLEGEVDYEIVNRIVSTMDFKMIKERMSQVFSLFVREQFGFDSASASLSDVEENLKKDSFNEKVEEGFNLYILMNKLADSSESAAKRLEPSSFGNREQFKAFTFFKEHTGRIEILVDKALQRIYFPILPVCKFISDSSKEELMDAVSRDSPASKVIDLLALSTGMIEEMEHNEWLSHAMWHPDMEKYLFLRDVCFALAFFINLLILMFLDFTQESDSYMDPVVMEVIEVCGAVLVACSGICVLLWLILKGSVRVREGWRLKVAVSSRVHPGPSLMSADYLAELTAKKTWTILLQRGPAAEEFWVSGNRDFRFLTTRIMYYCVSFHMLIRTSELQVLILYTLFAALGFFDLFFFAFLLTDIVFRFPTLRNLLHAITGNKNQLLMTSMLSLLVTFIYAIWGFYISPMMYYATGFGENGWGEPMCQDLWQCFLTTTDLGPRLSGGIGDVLWKFPFDEKYNWYSRFFLDLSYFLLFRIMFLNIILGTIIDSFAQMREKKKLKEADKKNKCFICSIERQVFDRANGHERHITEDHNVWHYIYFLVHLKHKDRTEWNGAESYCGALLDKGDVSWVPLHRAMCLKDNDKNKEEEDDLMERAENKVKEVSEQILEIKKLMKE